MDGQGKRRVRPETLKGFQDMLPSDMIARNGMVETIRGVYERYGFAPLDTPILERLETLVGTGGEETNKQLFTLESPEKEAAGMRFDLTVPFARLLAQYPEVLRLPFRRYHIGPVFRADKPGPGRFRQFTQFDIDAAGGESAAQDAELIAAMCEVMAALGLLNGGGAGASEFQIRVNNRKVVDAFLEGCGIGGDQREKQKHVLRVVDKLQKVGLENVKRELGPGRVDESGDKIAGVGLEAEAIEKIVGFIALTGDTRAEVLAALEAALPPTEASGAALREMRELSEALDALGVGEAEAVFDPSMARGLDYYTGTIFEGYLAGAEEFGSVMAGGRYDQLVARFMEAEIPASGVSIGVDRLLAALRHLGKIDAPSTVTRVLVTVMRGTPMPELLKVAAEIRRHGIPTEVYFGKAGTGMQKQLAYANAKGIPAAVIMGEDELQRGEVSVKDLNAGKQQRDEIASRDEYKKAGKTGQQTVPRGRLIEALRELLG
jgi:histidyl-tRNA synthetase